MASEFSIVCKKGFLTIAEFIAENHPHVVQEINRDLFNCVCRKGHLSVAKYILKLNPSFEIPIKNLSGIFALVCENGHLDTAKWLKLTWPNINHQIYNNHAFITSCKNGYFDVATYIYAMSKIDLSSIQLAFRSACSNGQAQIAKWLFDINPAIDASLLNNYAFKSACTDNHLEMAQWLASMDNNINSTDLSETYSYACRNGYIDVVQWLFEKWPQIYKSMYDQLLHQAISYRQWPIGRLVVEFYDSSTIANTINYCYSKFNDLDADGLSQIIRAAINCCDIESLEVDALHQQHFDSQIEIVYHANSNKKTAKNLKI